MKPVNISLPFKESLVHIVPDPSGSIKWICLHEICRIVDHAEIETNSQVLAICPGSSKFPIYTNGKLFWFVKISEINKLLSYLRKHVAGKTLICDELEDWISKLPLIKMKVADPETQTGETVFVQEKTEPDDKPSSKALYFHESPIYFKSENGKYYMNATQMSKNFGKLPREWLLLSETKRYRQALVDRGVSGTYESQVLTKRGYMAETWFEINLAIEFSRWLSPDLSTWFNEKIVELGLKGFVMIDNSEAKEVFVNKDSSMNYPVPTSYREALLLAAAQQEKLEEQSKIIEKSRHKIEFYDNFIENRDWFKSSTIADELLITNIQLYKFLSNSKIGKWHDKKKCFIVFDTYADWQLDAPYFLLKNDLLYKCGKIVRWTKTGREHIIELWKKKYPNKPLRASNR